MIIASNLEKEEQESKVKLNEAEERKLQKS